MPLIDESQLRQALSSAEAIRPGFRRPGLPGRAERLERRRAIEQLLKTSFAQAGVDTESLGRMLTDERNEQRRLLEIQRKEAAANQPAAHEAFRRRADNRNRSLALLAGYQPPPWIQIVNLTPFTIIEERFRYLVDSHIEPGNSWVKCNIYAAQDEDYSKFDFWFLWENPHDYPVVVNATSSLIFTGQCYVSAASGFFYGDMTSLSIGANLTPWEWWTSPQVPISDSEISQNVWIGSLQAVGWGLFGPGGPQQEQYNYRFQSYDMRYTKFAIPAKAPAVFTVSFMIDYQADDHLNIETNVTADFATEFYDSVICPGLQLEVLTPLRGV